MRKLAFVILMLLQPALTWAGTITFNFTLPEEYATSAGVYKDGTLVRTLWRNVTYPAGPQTYIWDGKDDNGYDAAGGVDYTIKILLNHMDYVWDGAIGNTSSVQTGPTIHRGIRPIKDMATSGNDAFYIYGYSENKFDFANFKLDNPQVLTDSWVWYGNPPSRTSPSTIYGRDWVATDTDGTWVYFASPNSNIENPSNPSDYSTYGNLGPGFITASKVSDHTLASFTNGSPIYISPMNPDGNGGWVQSTPITNGIKVSTVPGVHGLAVQKTGTKLAVSITAANKVIFYHKTTGAYLSQISVTAPKALAYDSSNRLWVVRNNVVECYADGATTPTTTISGFANALDVAVSNNGSVVAVVDGGTSQQVKTYDASGNPLQTYGLAGGYAANGPDVQNNKFQFSYQGIDRAFINIAPDGTVWLGDSGNHRVLHFTSTGQYIDQIMTQPAVLSASASITEPTRVFSDYLEFTIDYSIPLKDGWSLAKNWSANIPFAYFNAQDTGLRQVTKITIPEARTYGVVATNAANNTGKNKKQIVELTSTGLRLTSSYLHDIGDGNGLSDYLAPGTGADTGKGKIRQTKIFDASQTYPPGTTSYIKEGAITSVVNGDPNWPVDSALASIATFTANTGDPVNRCCSFGDFNIPETSSGVLLSMTATKSTGWHLGGVNRGGTSWLWKASPTINSPGGDAVTLFDGTGSFQIGANVEYPGNSVFASEKNVVFGYHGEMWNKSQAGQFMHFYDNGLFVGQFGETALGHDQFEGVVPGRAGNNIYSSLVKVGNETYLWTSDESQHGPQRWHLVGANTIREFSGSGSFGQTLSLTLPSAPFPTLLSATNGNAQSVLTWQGVTGATYSVKKSTNRGGPYTLVQSGIAGTTYTATGLTNGQSYYFVVSATVNSTESVNSDAVKMTPFVRNVNVQKAGSYAQYGSLPNILLVKSSAPQSLSPALKKLNPLLGDLMLNDIGRNGYQIFHWDPLNFSDLPPNFPTGAQISYPGGTPTSAGWVDDGVKGYSFMVDSTLGSNHALTCKASGGSAKTASLTINPGDSVFHCLTVVIPSTFRDHLSYRIKLTSGTLSEWYDIDDAQSLNRMFQFRFAGTVTLAITANYVDSASSNSVGLQAIFLD